jgi:hypothetical protein
MGQPDPDGHNITNDGVAPDLPLAGDAVVRQFLAAAGHS